MSTDESAPQLRVVGWDDAVEAADLPTDDHATTVDATTGAEPIDVELEAEPSAETPLNLSTRQDEVLKLLDDLNARIEAVLREFAPAPADGGAPNVPQRPDHEAA